MALACPIPEHPVGDGAFCRICGRSYVSVAEPVHAEPPPPPPEPVLDTGLIDTRFAELTAPEAPLGDLATVTVAAPAPEAEPSTHAKAQRAVPPVVVYALAGFGGGALVMALLDRLVL